ncbi:MAG: Rab family GTPase [Candidatus Heimdallarchaeota archaeon]
MSQEEILFEIPHHAQYKIVIVGDPLVGKTQLVSVFTKRDFEHKPTAGADISFLKIRAPEKTEGHTTAIFWDLSGQPTFDKVRPIFYEGAHSVIYVADVTRESTLISLPHWVKEVKKTLGTVPAVLCANKIDIKNREFQDEIGQRFADKLNAPYFPTSAVTGRGVGTAFASAIRRAVYYRDGEL